MEELSELRQQVDNLKKAVLVLTETVRILTQKDESAHEFQDDIQRILDTMDDQSDN
jgi:hypothetical protein